MFETAQYITEKQFIATTIITTAKKNYGFNKNLFVIATRKTTDLSLLVRYFTCGGHTRKSHRQI